MQRPGLPRASWITLGAVLVATLLVSAGWRRIVADQRAATERRVAEARAETEKLAGVLGPLTELNRDKKQVEEELVRVKAERDTPAVQLLSTITSVERLEIESIEVRRAQ